MRSKVFDKAERGEVFAPLGLGAELLVFVPQREEAERWGFGKLSIPKGWKVSVWLVWVRSVGEREGDEATGCCLWARSCRRREGGVKRNEEDILRLKGEDCPPELVSALRGVF